MKQAEIDKAVAEMDSKRLLTLEMRMDKLEASNAKIMQDVHALLERLVEIFADRARNL
jgi:hypothetical protein